MEPAKELSAQLAKSRSVKAVQINKDIKPAVVDKWLRELANDAKRKAVTKTVVVVSFEIKT
jgi:hypothetical protein